MIIESGTIVNAHFARALLAAAATAFKVGHL
jgi:hypothetical protein